MTTRGKMNERGMSAVEYGLMVALCAGALILGLQVLGVGLGELMDKCAEPSISKGYIDQAAGDHCPGDDF